MNYDKQLQDFALKFYSEQKSNLKLNKAKKKFLYHGNLIQSFNALLPNYVPPCMVTPVTFGIFSSEVVRLLKENQNACLEDDLKDTEIGVDILTGKKYVIEDGGIQPYEFQTFKESIDPEQFDLLYAEKKYIVVAFNPYKPLSWEGTIETTTGRKSFPHYNIYIKPMYAYKPKPKEFPLCEEFVAPFLENFLPNEDERQYVIYWLYMLRNERRNDILVLIGMQGNGKNTLMQLATIVAGKHNTIIGAKNFGKEKFNGEVYRRKLVTLDEFPMKGAAKESLKSFSNDDITVEVKGGDPIQVENHCSFIVANNSMRSTDLEFKDRRFTCPKLSDRDLLLDWSKDRIAAFKAAMKTDDFQIELPYWLEREVNRLGLNYPNQMNYITPHFYDLVEAAKPEWFKEFKRQLKFKKVVTSQDIFKATRTRVSDSRIEEELEKEIEERRHRDIEPHVLATVETEEGKTRYISQLVGEDNETDIPGF